MGSARLLAADGVWMAMKGKRPDDEIAALPDGIDVFHVEQTGSPGPHRRPMPGLDASRNVTE